MLTMLYGSELVAPQWLRGWWSIGTLGGFLAFTTRSQNSEHTTLQSTRRISRATRENSWVQERPTQPAAVKCVFADYPIPRTYFPSPVRSTRTVSAIPISRRTMTLSLTSRVQATQLYWSGLLLVLAARYNASNSMNMRKTPRSREAKF